MFWNAQHLRVSQDRVVIVIFSIRQDMIVVIVRVCSFVVYFMMVHQLSLTPLLTVNIECSLGCIIRWLSTCVYIRDLLLNARTSIAVMCDA
jgi:hypothetical protein